MVYINLACFWFFYYTNNDFKLYRLWEISSGVTEITKKYVDDNMPEGVTVIGIDAFSGRDNVVEFSMPASTEKIDMRAFKDCEHLRTVNLLRGLKKTCSSAFDGCPDLEDIDILDSVQVLLLVHSQVAACVS